MAGIEHFIVAFHRGCGGIIVGELGGRRCAECSLSISDNELAAQYYELSRRDQTRMLASISEACAAGNCDRCPGMLERKGAEPIFCVHGCHRAPA